MKANASFINRLIIEGYVYGVGSGFNELTERVSGENSKNPGTKYIAGDLEIVVDEAGLNVVTMHYAYVTETTKKGTPNNTYTTLKRIIDNPERRWVNAGKDNAYKVRCEGGAINVNDFIAGDGARVAALRNEGGFCSLISAFTEEEIEKRTSFNTDMLITKVTPVEVNPEKNITEPYVSVSGCIFGYGNPPKLIPATFVVRDKGGMQHFESLEPTASSPVFTRVWGRLNCMTIKIERKEESAFGEAAVQTFERKSKEYTITGALKIPYDFGDEEVLTAEDVLKMSQEREVMLAEVEKRASERKNNTTPAPAATKKAASGVPEGGFVF